MATGLEVEDLLLQLEAAEEVFEELTYWKALAIEQGASPNAFIRSRMELLPPPEPEPLTGGRVREVLQRFGRMTMKELALELDAEVAKVREFVKPMELGGTVVREGRQLVFVPAPADSTPRPSHLPPEKEPPSYADAPRRGEPVRIRTERDDRRKRSTPGARQKILNQDRNWKRMQEAKQKRAQENAQREAKPSKWEVRRAKNKARAKK